MTHKTFAVVSSLALVSILVLSAGLTSSGAAAGPYASALSASGAAGAAERNPLCNQKECSGNAHCRDSRVLSHCTIGDTGCVTLSCTR